MLAYKKNEGNKPRRVSQNEKADTICLMATSRERVNLLFANQITPARTHMWGGPQILEVWEVTILPRAVERDHSVTYFTCPRRPWKRMSISPYAFISNRYTYYNCILSLYM